MHRASSTVQLLQLTTTLILQMGDSCYKIHAVCVFSFNGEGIAQEVNNSL